MNTQMIHPMLVHFPVALLIIGFLFISLAMFCKRCSATASKSSTPLATRKCGNASCVEMTGFWLLGLGAISACVALLSGYVFTHEMLGLSGQNRETHAAFALITTVVAVIAFGIYAYYMYTPKKVAQIRWIAYVLYIGVAVLISITGHLGGSMVF